MPDPSCVPRRARRRGAPLSPEEELSRAARRRTARHRSGSPAPDPNPAAAVTSDPSSAPPRRAFRPELQGLRAVAILMVVCYHIWFGRVSGGVDIFLLISAFLMTGSIVRRLEQGRSARVLHFWLRTFRRLLPPSALVILLTIGASLLVLPSTRWLPLLTDAAASIGSLENWLLAARSTDYYAADRSGASPLQNFWSLSIQGQVFLLWPLLLALGAVIARRARLALRPVLLVLFSAVFAGSLAWSIHLTATDQAVAYFDTRTRLWEFALGSLLALTLPWIERRTGRGEHLPEPGGARVPRAIISWIALALVLACGWVVDVEGAFPGWIALWPLLAAALVIIAGSTGTRWGADRLLSSRPLQWCGDISYALYLVHWPLLVLTMVALGTGHLNATAGTLVVLASLVLAWLITRFLDTPIRRSPRLETSWPRSLAVIAISCALVLGTSEGIRWELESRAKELEAAKLKDHPGARVLLPDYEDHIDPGTPPRPDLASLPGDLYHPQGDCTDLPVPSSGDLATLCHELTTPADPEAPLVVVAGNSHAVQALPMLVAVAKERGWRLVSVARPICSFGTVTSIRWCGAYNTQVIRFLKASRASALIVHSTYSGVPDGASESVAEGFEDAAAQVLDAGIPILALRDNPRLPESFEDCFAGTGPCSYPVSATHEPEDPGVQLAATLNARPGVGTSRARITQIDLTDQICPDSECVPVVGNVYTYADNNHLSSTYSATLAPVLDARIEQSGFRPR